MSRLALRPTSVSQRGPVVGSAVGAVFAVAILVSACTGTGQEAPARDGATSATSDVARIGACLERAGFDVTVDERHHAIESISTVSTGVYDRMYQACRRQAGL